ncbi:MAG TPA: TRAP transporter large permease subunit, partial [Pseudogracilibacillus sp.]|nr:TRAP transporter large permease subunit [Pseudogracilibacillus sp.]
MTILLFSILIVLFLIGVPIAVSLGMASSTIFLLEGNVSVVALIQRMYNSVGSFPLLAIPFFILAGNLMESG